MLGLWGKQKEEVRAKQEPYLGNRKLRQPKSASTRRYEALLQHSGLAFIVIDSNGKIAEMSQAAKVLFETENAENYTSFFSYQEQSSARPTLVLREAYEKGNYTGSAEFVSTSGKTFLATIEMLVIYRENRVSNGCIVYFNPQTTNSNPDRGVNHDASINTLDTPETFESIGIDAIKDCIVILDLAGNTVWVNSFGLEILEVEDIKQVLGSNWLKSWQGDTLHSATNALATARMAGTGRFQGLAFTRSGAPKWWDVIVSPVLDQQSNPIYITASGRDITEYKLQEEQIKHHSSNLEYLAAEKSQQLELSKTRQAAILNSAQQPLGIIDLQGNIMEANKAALDLVGLGISDVKNQPVWTSPWFANTPGMSEIIRIGVEQAKEGMGVQKQITVEGLDGIKRNYDFTLNPVRAANGTVIEIIPAAKEIVENTNVEEWERLKTLYSLTGNLADNYNRSFQQIENSLQTLKNSFKENAPAFQNNDFIANLEIYIEQALAESRKAASINNGLLTFSPNYVAKIQTVSVNTTLDQIKSLIEHTMGPLVQIEMLLGNDIWKIRADPDGLKTALLNLCVNSKQAMLDGGYLMIGTKNLAIEQESERLKIKPGEYVIISVLDTGTGMDQVVINQAFDPFYTTKPSSTGLGLSQVYSFTQPGGTVTLTSEPGKGTEVTVYLPRSLE